MIELSKIDDDVLNRAIEILEAENERPTETLSKNLDR